MVKFKIYVTQITMILATKLTVLVIHIRGVWGSSNQITQHLRQYLVIASQLNVYFFNSMDIIKIQSHY